MGNIKIPKSYNFLLKVEKFKKSQFRLWVHILRSKKVQDPNKKWLYSIIMSFFAALLELAEKETDQEFYENIDAVVIQRFLDFIEYYWG